MTFFETLLSVTLGGAIASLIPFFQFKKTQLQFIQQKGFELTTKLYEYQELLSQTETLDEEVRFEHELIGDISDQDKQKAQYEKFIVLSAKLDVLNDKKQEIRDTIWSYIRIFFPEVEQLFREYTTIEIFHKNADEINTERDCKLNDIAEHIYNTINKSRKFLFVFSL